MTATAVLAVIVASGTAVIAAAVILVLRHRFTIIIVRGPSMKPALQSGDTLLARRTRGEAVCNGDVVILRVPIVPGASGRYTVVKRVAATAGDPVPAYLPPATNPGTGLLPAGQLAVLGDNAASSADSRVWGLIPAGDVLAKVIRKLLAAGSEIHGGSSPASSRPCSPPHSLPAG
jgi:signal peptidase I